MYLLRRDTVLNKVVDVRNDCSFYNRIRLGTRTSDVFISLRIKKIYSLHYSVPRTPADTRLLILYRSIGYAVPLLFICTMCKQNITQYFVFNSRISYFSFVVYLILYVLSAMFTLIAAVTIPLYFLQSIFINFVVQHCIAVKYNS